MDDISHPTDDSSSLSTLYHTGRLGEMKVPHELSVVLPLPWLVFATIVKWLTSPSGLFGSKYLSVAWLPGVSFV